MAFDWAEYLRLAKELASVKADEARCRSAVSRAYYAAFHAADSLLRATNPRWETPRHNAHEQIWNAVGSASAKREFWNLKVKGERLKVSRVCADYRVLQNPAREAENAVAQAQFIVTQVQALIAQ